MFADSEGHETAATDLERAAHAYCATCHPKPRPGELLTALCGARHPFWGRRDRSVNTCKACEAAASAAVFTCGHSAR